MKNPYTVLGVKPSQSLKEIKVRYKVLSKQYHPDNQTTGNIRLFNEVLVAWKYLEEHHVVSSSLGCVWKHKTLFNILKEEQQDGICKKFSSKNGLG